MRHAAFDCETTARNPIEGEVIAICVVKEKRGSDSVDKQVFNQETCSEKDIIELFVTTLEKLDSESKVVSYNGDTFDWPFLIARSTLIDDYGDLTDRLFELKEKHGHDLFKTHGQVPGYYYRLEELLEQYGLSHDVDCSGSEVLELFEAEEWGKIREYVKEDTWMTYRLFKEIDKKESEKDKSRKSGGDME